jgi:hypothetical protein
MSDRGFQIAAEDHIERTPLIAIANMPPFDHGLCAETDPEAFFPEKGGSTREARSICARCSALVACLDYAIANEIDHGIWGGTTSRQRRAIRHAMHAATQPTIEVPA